MSAVDTKNLPEETEEVSALDRVLNQPGMFRKTLWRLGLQARLVISFTLIMLIAISVFMSMVLRSYEDRISEVINAETKQLSSEIALQVSADFNAHRIDKLQIAADKFISNNEAVAEIIYHDASGKVIATSKKVRSKPQPLKVSVKYATATLKRDDFWMTTIMPIFEANTKNISGYVRMTISLDRYDQQIEGLKRNACKVGLLLIMCAAGVTWMIIRGMFHPIHALVHAARQISAGNMDMNVATNRPDAIGELGRAFNEMIRTVRRQQTALKRANSELGVANRDLEKKVDQRTSQIDTANKRLSAEIAEKEDFLRAVSHDLNAPLRNISGMVTMLLMKKKDSLEEDVIQRLDRIKKNVEIETDLINELLELSRIKTRRQAMEQVDIERMVWELRGMFENDLKTKHINLIIDTMLPALYCEKARVRQVFQNLIDNAIKYMGDGSTKEIHVGCQMRLSEAEFYIRDTGMGIDEEDIGKVFFVFRRGKNTAAQNIAGKGVGLASVKSIVETYSGKIWVESKVQEGTTFRFTVNGQYVPATGGGARAVNGPDQAEAQAA